VETRDEMRVETKWKPHSSRSVAIGWVNVHAHLDGGARLVSRRRRAHERVRGMSESPEATSESAGEGVAENRVRVLQSRDRHSRSIDACERIGWGGCSQVLPGCYAIMLVTVLPQNHIMTEMYNWN